MIDPILGYSPETQKLIEKLCAIAERKSYVLEKEKAEECLLQTYDIFGLPRPKKIVWHNRLTNGFLDTASSTYNARSAYNASNTAYNAYSPTYSASRAYNAYNASRARASSAYSASMAYSTSSAYRSSVDYDFDYSVRNFEFIQNPEGLEINENDKKYLEYSQLVIAAKEFGAGYFCDFGETLHIVPVPIIYCNEAGAYHRLKGPAIFWGEYEGIFYLNGIRFDEKLYWKIVDEQLTFAEIMQIEDVDQRTQAMRFVKDKKAAIKEMKGVLIDTYTKLDKDGENVNYELYKFPKGEIFSQDAYYCLMDCPSTGKQHFEGADRTKEWVDAVQKLDKNYKPGKEFTIPEVMAWSLSDESDEETVTTPNTWKLMVPLIHEV